MSSKLVIVESPTKARTITRFLGQDVRVLASMGHVRDLPENSLGVDVAHEFQPAYVLTRNGRRVLDDLRRAARTADDLYLATDPDREGEAIAWHIRELLKPATEGRFHRITFHEITRDAIQHAFTEPGDVDLHRVDAQQARRVLDRLVGYEVSPLLWRAIQKGTSAGRVQSVALRLICERERQILNFTPVEYWTLDALFQPTGQDDTSRFQARLTQLDGAKPQIPNAETAGALVRELEAAAYRVAAVNRTPKSQRPPPPFITSTLQQAAGNSLRLGAGQTMRLAQELYEGIELGSEGAVGLITYMRTDSVEVAREAQEAGRAFVARTFGPEYLPERPNVYRSRQSAQGAHEAIRPTDVTRTPDAVAPHLSPNQLRLYRLIWNRFVASQMAAARFLEHQIEVAAEGGALTHQYLFRATASLPQFAGYLKVYDWRESDQAEGEEPADESAPRRLPEVAPGAPCDLRELLKAQAFTEPPKRYSEAMLVRELEQNGIGRPSTYATIVETIQDREYVTKDKGRLTPTPLGFKVNDFLSEKLPDLFQVGFTAEMEAQLDHIEEGKVAWHQMMEEFYRKFREWTGGAAGNLGAPANARVLAFLQLFPADLPWQAPVKRGTRTYDDAAFHKSLIEQASGKKPVSDKQWQAILSLAARYADHIPGLLDAAADFGVRAELEALIARERSNPRGADAGPQPTPNADRYAPVLEALRKVEWEKPARRGGRTFDDRRFFTSLSRQARDGRDFSEPQVQAICRLAVKYQGQLPDFADLATRFPLQPPASGAPGAQPGQGEAAAPIDPARVTALLEILERIQTWEKPTRRGRRTYDDREFATSIRDQFSSRRQLSDKQVGALVNLIRKYASQIPDYETLAERLALPPPRPPRGADGARGGRPKAEPTEAKCPQCGAQLLRRHGRGRIFYGCSAFPKCRFTTEQLPAPSGT